MKVTQADPGSRVVWVHNFATHYTVGLFERVSRRLPIDFLFFSSGEVLAETKRYTAWHVRP